MKLNQKISKLQLLVLLLVVPIAGLGMFLGLRFFLEGEVYEKLHEDEVRITKYLEKNKLISLQDITYQCSVIDNSIPESKVFSKEYIKEENGGNEELFMVLTLSKRISDLNYAIVLRQPILETKDFAYVILMTIAIFLIISLVLFQLFFWRIQKNVWLPFFKSLESLKEFSLGDSKVPTYDESLEIEEFDSLNRELNFMTKKILSDYKNLKEFSENAAHESQTPLAILSLKLEDLMQCDLPEEILNKIYKAFQVVVRLSSLNEKLLLLTKIENKEFANSIIVNISDLLEDGLERMHLIVEQKNLTVNKVVNKPFIVNGDQNILTILVDNILSNAIKHNVINGFIAITSDKESITIVNKYKSKVDIDKVFNRFYKTTDSTDSTDSKESHGLGLSISEKIAVISNLKLKADLDEDFFSIEITRC